MALTYFFPSAMGMLTPIHEFMKDIHVSEILLNKPKEVWVEKCNTMAAYEVEAFCEGHLHHLFQLIATENHQILSASSPFLSGNLTDGSRIQLLLPPITKYPTFALRRKVVHRISLHYYEEKGLFSDTVITQDIPYISKDEHKLLELYQQKKWFEFLKLAIHVRKNIVVSGGTASGKTTFLNSCLAMIEKNCRLIMLEDTREIETFHKNQVRLLTLDHTIKITMQNLLKVCLRLRPDRIIVGEVRGAEIADFIAACITGHDGAMTSLHASSPQLAFARMLRMYKMNPISAMSDKEILSELLNAIDIVVQLQRGKEGCRISEIWYRAAIDNKKMISFIYGRALFR